MNMAAGTLFSRWLVVIGLLTAHAAVLIAFRSWFNHEQESLADYPARWLAVGLMSAGLVFLALVPLIENASRAGRRETAKLLTLIIAGGLFLRLLMLWTTPALEDDFYRYLLDGGVTANGYNPYAVAPASAEDAHLPKVFRDLAEDAGHVRDRINHPKLRTIYPPVTQAAFALAHLAEPWSLLAWRIICVAGEVATMALILALLREVGRSSSWLAIYWWNPLVIKETINSAHMEAILMPLVLASLLLAARRRHMAAMGMLGLACGAKVWPIILAPLLLRPLVDAPRRLLLAGTFFAGLLLLFAWPPLQAGLDQTSGIVAYATQWQTNSALTPALTKLVGVLGGMVSLSPERAPGLARLMLTGTICIIALWIAFRPIEGAHDLLTRSTLLAATMLLLSPAQFPWYLIWVQPLLALYPVNGLLAATMLMPIYYASFYFHANDSYWIFRDYVVWAIWIPIWTLIVLEIRRTSRRSEARPAPGTA